jgi:hypothetical protein
MPSPSSGKAVRAFLGNRRRQPSLVASSSPSCLTVANIGVLLDRTVGRKLIES